MNKRELIVAIAERCKTSKSDAKMFVESYTDLVSTTLSEGESVTISGFGSFTLSHRVKRNGRNPQNGEPITIGASMVPKFVPGKLLKAWVSKG